MNVKELTEKQNDLKSEMIAIVNKAKEETRELTDEEKARFDACKTNITGIEDTINRMEELNTMNLHEVKEETPVMNERKQFENMIRGYKNDLGSLGDGKVVVPTTIGEEILVKVKNICPIYALAQRYNVKGTLVLAKEGSSTLAMSYSTDGTNLNATGTTLEKNIELGTFVAGVLTKVSNTLINNVDFDIVNYVEDRIAEAVAVFIEHEILIGTSSKATGMATGITKQVTAAKATTVSADELIDVQESIPDVYQSGAVWIMNSKTRAAIRKLKDGQGNYLLVPDFSAQGGYTLLGKPVYCSDNMPVMAAKAKAIYYGDPTGVAVKLSKDFSIKPLTELYYPANQTGFCGFTEFDCNVQNDDKLAMLVMASA